MAQVTFNELVRAGREMRKHQRFYFLNSHKSRAEKAVYLAFAKASEAIFDALIDPDREKQLEMFEEPELVQTARGIEKRSVVASVEG